jgi:hypothetical protein
MKSPNNSIVLKTDATPSVVFTAPSSDSLLDPKMIETLNQLAPDVLFCVLFVSVLYFTVRGLDFGVRLMEQINKFIELVKR